MPRLDIAIVCHNFPPHVGGVERVAYEQSVRLAERGHDVTVYTSEVVGAPEAERPIELPDSLRLRRLPARLRVGNMPLLSGLGQAAGHEVVHLHLPFLFGGEIVGRATRRRGVPLVVSFHAGDVPFRALDLVRAPSIGTLAFLYIRHLSLRCARRATRVCLLSEAQDRHPSSPLAALVRDHPERRAVVPNGVDLDLFRPPTREERLEAHRLVAELHGFEAEAPLAMWCGRLDATSVGYKRLDLALRCLQLAATPFQLVVCGDGPLRERWRAEAQEMGLGDRVHFAGSLSREQMALHYRAAELYAMSSLGPEAFPLTMLEAMATATPVIVPALLDIETVIGGDRGGVLVEPGNPGALAKAMDRVHDLPVAEREALGAAARERVESSYSWDASASRLETVLQEAVAHGA